MGAVSFAKLVQDDPLKRVAMYAYRPISGESTKQPTDDAGSVANPFRRRLSGQSCKGRSSDLSHSPRLPVRRRTVASVESNVSCGDGIYSSGNCCRFARHSLLIP